MINLNRCTNMPTKKGMHIGVGLCASIGLAVGALIGGTARVGASTGVILGLARALIFCRR